MPKIIPGLENKIIQQARTVLFNEGYDALSMRRMANDCNIAVGTIYNYVRDKSDLIAKIALSDWIKTVQKIVEVNDNEKDFTNGVMTIYKYVKAFNDMYIGYWTGLNISVNTTHDVIDKYHAKFRSEVQRLINQLVVNDEQRLKEYTSKMLAELLTSLVVHSDNNEKELRAFIDSLNI